MHDCGEGENPSPGIQPDGWNAMIGLHMHDVCVQRANQCFLDDQKRRGCFSELRNTPRRLDLPCVPHAYVCMRFRRLIGLQ